MEQVRTDSKKITPLMLILDSEITRPLFPFERTVHSEFCFDYILNENRRAEWITFWANAKHSHAQQHFYHAEIEIAKKRNPVYVMGLRDNKIVIAGIFSIRPLFSENKYSLEAVCLRGPVFDDVDILRQFLPMIIERVGQLRVGSIRLSPYWKYPEALQVEMALKEFGFKPYYPKEGSRSFTGYIDLSLSLQEMYALLSKSAKESIKRIDSLGITFKDVTEFEDIEDSYRCLNAMRLKNGLTQNSLEEFRAAFKWMLRKQEIGILTNAYKDGQFLGTLWSMRGPEVVHLMGYAIDHETTNKLVKRYTLGFMLWWRHMLWAKKQGALFYDVEGYRADGPNSHPMKRIWDFKEKFGTKQVCILSEHTFVCNRIVHFAYRASRFAHRGLRFLTSLPYQWQKRTCNNFSRAARMNNEK